MNAFLYLTLRKNWYEAYIPVANIFATTGRMEKMFKTIGQVYNTNLSEALK